MAKKKEENKVERKVVGTYEFAIGDEVVSDSSGRSGRISKFTGGDNAELKADNGATLTVNLTNFLPYEIYLQKSRERFKITS